MISAPRLNFAKRLVHLDGTLINFDGRPYLPAVYASTARNIVVRASRQVEKSTYLVLSILHLAAVRPGVQILYVCPRWEQARFFARQRLIPTLENSPILRHVLMGDSRRQLPIMNMRFANGSAVSVRAAYLSADPVRGISADVLLVDEFQDVAAGNLPVLQECLSHSKLARTILCGTPKLVDNHLETMFTRSTAHERLVPCPQCGRDVLLDERCLGAKGITCPDCQVLLDKLAGRWVARDPGSTWGDGFWLNALMVPWKENFEELLECQRTYDFARFKNEVLGLPVSLGEHVVTRAQLEACCTDTAMAVSIADVPARFRRQLLAGIDWGGGSVARTAVVVGFMRPEGVFEICHFARIHAREDAEIVKEQVAEICRKFNVQWIGADGLGNGNVYNRLLLSAIEYKPYLYALLYSATSSPAVQDGVLWKWSIGRTSSIGYLFSCVQKQKIRFPRAADCGTFLDEFACEVAEYDEHNRSVKYTHPAGQPDDAMHAANYAFQLAVAGFPALGGDR